MTDPDALHIRETAPDAAPRGAFLLLHGMESHAGWFVDCAARLVRNGWAVLAFDRPGWGKSPGPRGHMTSYRDLVDLTSRLAARARRKYGAVHLAGMSWGGMAALYCALRTPWLFDSVSLIAPGVATRRDLPFPEKAKAAWNALRRDGNALLRPGFRLEDFTRDPQWRHFIESDPDRVTAVTTSFCIESLKMRHFIREHAGKRRLPPALCLLAGEDGIVDNPATAHLCRKAGALVQYIPRAAHTLIFEKPAQTAGIIDHHAEEARKAAAAARRAADKRGGVWVVGAGAVGGAVASLLSFGGVHTGVLVKPSHCTLLRKSGLTLRCGEAVRSARPAVAADPAHLPPDPRLVILAVKSFDTLSALAPLRGKLPPETCLLSLQNGVRNEDAIARAFPRHTLLAGAVCAGLEQTAPGVVRWAGDRGGLAAACFAGDAARARFAWESTLPRTGMECAWVDGDGAASRVKWSKLMLNIGFNALNALTGMPSSRLLRNPLYGALSLAAQREGFALMRALHVHPVDFPGFPVSTLAILLRAPDSLARRLLAWQASRGAEAASSMRQDVSKKRQHTEINELNGEIVASSKPFGIATPANEKLVELVEKFQ